MLFIILLTCIGTVPLANGILWHITTVYSANSVNPGASIAVDSCCHVYISYGIKSGGQGHLALSTRVGNAWSEELITSDPTYDVLDTSIALDSQGLPHICYLVGHSVYYAQKLFNGTWIFHLVDSDFPAGLYAPSLALDSNDKPHIIYISLENGLKYAENTGGVWNIVTLDSTASYRGPSLALDSSDHPHISYSDARGLIYTWWDGSVWKEQIFESGHLIFRTSIALDSGDKPHISYHVDDDDTLRHVMVVGGAWSIATVDSSGNVGWDNCIAVDSANNSHISYRDFGTAHGLKYAVGQGMSWSIETVELGNFDQITSIALDSNEQPHITYVNADDQSLKHAGPLGLVTDLAVDMADPFQHVVSLGNYILIHVRLLNQGSELATFNATAFANKTRADWDELSLEPGKSTLVNLTWPAKLFMKGNFSIEIAVDILPCEVDVEDNSMSAGWIFITIQGDVNGDRTVDIFDIVNIAADYGLSYPDPKYDPNNDLDVDYDIDIFDIVAAASHYGESW